MTVPAKQSRKAPPAKRAPTKAKAVKHKAMPAKPAQKTSPLDGLRKVCSALPEATEKIAWGEPTFRVRDKIFAMFANDHHDDGRIAVWCKAPMGMQEILIDADPERFFRPPYVGPKGWIGIRLDGKVDWQEVHALIAESWRMTAPPKLAATLARDDD